MTTTPRRPSFRRGWLPLLLCGVSWCARADSSIPGVTRPLREATLSAAASGIVARIPAREGDAVRKDQVLIELDRRQEELEVERRKLLWENPAELQAAEARRATARTEYEATRALFEATKSVSREEMDRKRLEYDLATAEHLRAEMNKARERIEYDMALEALARRSVRAPFDGVVTELMIKEGEGCEIRQPLAAVVDPRTVEFEANIEAPVLARFAVGRTVELAVGEDGALRVTGEVSYVSPVVDAASGLGVLKVTFDNAESRMRPGAPAVLRTVPPETARP